MGLTATPDLSVQAVPGTTKTHCPFCALNCGLQLENNVDDGLSVSKWREAPLTQGALCIKGRLAHEQVAHPDRLRLPLVRRNGELEEVSWAEGLDRAAAGFEHIRSRHGADANAVLGGGSLTNEKVYAVGKFARLVFGTPHVDYNGRFCMTSAGAAHTAAFGLDRMMTPLGELANAEVVVVVGANLSAAFPVRIPPLVDGVRRRGGRVVVIDPRRSRFCKDDDLQVGLRPGTDSVFFGGVLREVAESGLVDASFVRDRTSGFDDALAAVAHLTPDVVAATCDVDADLVREVAALVAGTSRCMWLHGRGPEQQVGGVQHVLSIINIGLACGHVGQPGAGVNMLTGQRNGQGGREWGQRCNQLPAGRSIDDPAHRQVVADHWGVDVDRIPHSGSTYVEILQGVGDGRTRGLLSICTNIAVSAPDLTAVDRRLEALAHHVVIDPFLTESARHADVVLPGTTFTEESGTITTLEGRVVRIDQASEPLPGLDDLDVLRELAARLGGAHHLPTSDPTLIFDEMRRVSAGGKVDYSGMTLERLRSEDGLFWPCPSEGHPGTPQLFAERFAHADGRARFHPVDPPSPPIDTDDQYPLVLTTGRVLEQFLSGSQTRRIAELERRAPGPVLEIHPATASNLGLGATELVEVTSRQGRSTMGWKENTDLRLDTVFLPYHWTECNTLVAEDIDPVSRIPGFKFTPVRVAPARQIEILP